MTDQELSELVDRILNYLSMNSNNRDDFKEFLDGCRNRDDLKILIKKHVEKGTPE